MTTCPAAFARSRYDSNDGPLLRLTIDNSESRPGNAREGVNHQKQTIFLQHPISRICWSMQDEPFQSPPPEWPSFAVTGLVDVTGGPIDFTPVPRARKRRNGWT